VRVVIVIVGFRNFADVRACLTALEASIWTDFEVVIVENGGAEAVARLREGLPARLASGQAVTLVDAGANLGFAGGVNRGLTTRRGAAWWILNPDTLPQPGALAAMVARLEVGDVDAVGSVLLKPDGRVQALGGVWRGWLARAVSLGIDQPAEAQIDAADIERRQTYINGASCLVSARFVETIGLMREDYFLYCEEVEWCLRARRAGLKLGFAPEARVAHLQGTTTGGGPGPRGHSRLFVHLNERNRLLLTRDTFPARLPVAALASLALAVLKYGRRGAVRQLAWAIAGWRDGALGRRRLPAWIPAKT
jgi:GT2 family glycosyltransferase